MLEFPKLAFFLGANTPQGFYSLFDELYNPESDDKMYIIKGGPGTGKSGLMNAVANAVEKEGYLCERMPCSSDPDSLDAILFPELHVALADGTSPHTIEPKFPGVSEQTLNLGDFWDERLLRKNAAEIRRLTKANSEEHNHCVRFLSAVKAIDNDSLRTVSMCVDAVKIENYAKRLAGRLFRSKGSMHERGIEDRRFLSAISPKGVSILYDSIKILCDSVISIKDEYGLVSSLLLNELKEHAMKRGYNIIACYCPLRPSDKVEHLFIPELGLGFFTENAYHSLPEKAGRTIHSKRFCNAECLTESQSRLRFNTKARRDLINEAISRLELAKSLHDKLEAYYINVMDFKKVQNLAENIIKEILNKLSD